MRSLRYYVGCAAFDVNGTLVPDTPSPFLIVINMMFRELAYRFPKLALALKPLPHEILRREFGQPWTKVFRERGVTAEVISDEELYEIYNKFYKSFPKSFLAKGAFKTLKDLKKRGFHLAIVSTQKQEMNDWLLKDIPGFYDLFSDLRHGVQNKEQALAELNGRYGGTAYVGDQVGDMLAAKAVDAIAIAYTGGLHPRDMLDRSPYDFLIDAFPEICRLPIFSRLERKIHLFT